MSHIRQCVNGFVATSSSIQWTIRAYDSRIQTAKREFTSPRFRFLEADWNLIVNAYRNVHPHNTGRMHLALHKLCLQTGWDTFHAEMSIRTTWGKVLGCWSGECETIVDEDELGWGMPVEGAELDCVNENTERLLTFTVFCSLNKREMAEAATQMPEADVLDDESRKETNQLTEGKDGCEGVGKGKDCSTGLDELSQNFSDLLLSERLSDVSIKIEGETFLAHRAVLAARSPVFQAMLEHDTAEKNSGVIEISDCSPVAFKEFLQYLYSGGSEGLTQENVCGVYRLADKYDVGHLKTECVAIMTRGLDEASFCDVISLAAKHDESELVEFATDFFVKQAKNIVPTVRWQTFMAENITMANELFLKTLNKSD